MNYFKDVELDIIGAMFARDEMRADILTLESKYFIKYKDFFEKAVSFHKGVAPSFNQDEWAYVENMSKSFWCPPVLDNMIDDLKKSYIEDKIKSSKVSSKEDLEKLIESIYEMKENKEKTVSECLEEILIEESEGKIRGIDFGIRDLDNITLGLKEGHFNIIGGYTSCGKTSLALEIVRRVAKENKVFFYSIEMTSKDITKKILDMERRELDKNKALDSVFKMNLNVFDSIQKLSSIESHITAQKEKPKVVFVDFIQNVETKDKNEYERLTNVARGLQQIALREKICIVALSQVSNESANRQTKTIGFKGSGALAAACDLGIEIVKDDGEKDTVPFILLIRKNRHGRTGKIEFEFSRSKNLIIFTNDYQ